ncbi:acyl-CoA dehydrogenase [Nocardia vaccinii]|uniref:acyl-CoA dehydrogenase n=1 Tax=Nocardia vaccinii TaxID=1822 RepID=UPI000834902F|nr:acyl-CoA dehydrogenase [Nocardia vaccinii]
MTDSEQIRWITDSVEAALLALDIGTAGDETDDGHRAWKSLVHNGMTLVGVPEEAGGSGGGWAEAAAVLAESARHGVSLPILETAWLAAHAAVSAGLSVPAGRATIAIVAPDMVEDGGPEAIPVLAGTIARVPFLPDADEVFVLAPVRDATYVARLTIGSLKVRPGATVAAEPRGDLVLGGPLHTAEQGWADIDLIGRLHDRLLAGRVVQGAAVARTVQGMTLEHTETRVQFGRPLIRLQAVQHRLARLAANAEVLQVCSRVAVAALDKDVDDQARRRAITSAALASFDAVGAVVEQAQQLHGAMGFTREHALARSTLRMLGWRQELGGARCRGTELAHDLLDSDLPVWDRLAPLGA